MLNNWQRIEQIIKWTEAASVSAFAREIGLNRGENLYQIKRGNNGISKELAETITNKYPQISRAWLLTGEGEMLPDEALREKVEIPFYKVDAVQYIMYDADLAPTYNISFPLFRGSDFAAFSFSDAMMPDIPQGAVLFFQEAQVSAIHPGATYLVVSDSFLGIRTLRKEPESTIIRLVPKNKESYDDVIIDEKEIKRLFVVRGVAVNKSI